MRKFFIIISSVLIIVPLLMGVTQTGTVIIKVTTEEGQILPGASVHLRSNAMMGERIIQADRFGKAVFRTLPPGQYIIDISMETFNTSRVLTRVTVGQTRTLIVPLELSMSDTISVVHKNPLLGTRSSALQEEFDFENSINYLPTDRHYSDVLAMTAGASEDKSDPNVYGASTSDNSYIVDGSPTIDPVTQTWSDQFNVDIISEISTQTAGISAEYSLLQGAVMNIITKSGSNEFSGIARFEFNRIKWNDLDENYTDPAGNPTKQGYDQDDVYLSGGGPALPDYLWWYMSWNNFDTSRLFKRHTNPLNPSYTEPAKRAYIGEAISLKGTFQITNSFKGNILYMSAPVEIRNVSQYYSWFWQETSDVTQEQGSDISLVFNTIFILNDEMFLEGSYSHGEKTLNVIPQEVDDEYVFTATRTEGPTYHAWDNWWMWGSAWYDYRSERNSDLYSISFNWLLDTEGFGYHDFKAGFEVRDNYTVKSSYQGGMPAGDGVIYTFANQDGYAFNDWSSAPGWKYRYNYENPLPAAENHNKYYSAYLQDSIDINENLTINIGLRIDPNRLTNNMDRTIAEPGILGSLAPRLGFSYRLSSDLSVRGTYGRMYDLFDLAIADTFNSYSSPMSASWYWWTGDDWTFGGAWTIGSIEWQNSIDDDFTQMYADEYTIGIDYYLTSDIAFSVSGIWRQFRDGYCAEDLDNDRVTHYMNVNTDAFGSMWKEYKGVSLRAVKRPGNDNLFLRLSWTFQSIEGFEWLANGLDYGVTSAGDVYYHSPEFNNEMAEYWWGDLGYETMTGRAQFTYFVKNGLYFGANISCDNNNRETSYQSAVETFQNMPVRYDAIPNGHADIERLPWQIEFDLQIGFEKAWDLPVDVPLFDDNLLFAVYLNINNILNEQVPVNIQNNLDSPYYGEYTGWQRARELQVGVRLEL